MTPDLTTKTTETTSTMEQWKSCRLFAINSCFARRSRKRPYARNKGISKNEPKWTLLCNCASQSASIDFPFIAKTRAEMCPATSDAVAIGSGESHCSLLASNFWCCPGSRRQQTRRRRVEYIFSSWISYSHANKRLYKFTPSIRNRSKFIN